MDGLPKRGSIARRRATAAAVCSVLTAVVGGALLAVPATADGLGASETCSGAAPTTVVDTTGAGSGVVNLGSTDGLIGLTASATGAGIGLLDCTTGAALDSAPSQPTSTVPQRPVSRTQTTLNGVDATADGTAAAADGTTAHATPVSTAAAAAATRVARVSVLRSSNTVYPVKDGFRDSVRFAVRAMNAAGALIPVVGDAVLTRAGRTVARWDIGGSTDTITWNGRVGRRIEAGLYALTVTARSTDGSTRSGRALVRVLDQHLVQHAVTVRSNVGARSVSADMPHELLKASVAGKVTCRVVTVATVRGPARLVYSHDGVSRSLTLRDGSHTTKALPVPQGFDHVTITHDWVKGAAHLKSLRAIWTYYTLS